MNWTISYRTPGHAQIGHLSVMATGDWTPDPNGGYRAAGVVVNGYAVNGQVTIRHRPNGSYGIYDETYDFEMHSWIGMKNIARNIGAIIGRPRGMSYGAPYKVNFAGDTNIINPRN